MSQLGGIEARKEDGHAWHGTRGRVTSGVPLYLLGKGFPLNKLNTYIAIEIALGTNVFTAETRTGC